MNKQSEYYDKFEWALTEKAKAALEIMIASGIDKDLALFMLEQKWLDKDIYEIPDKDEVK